ncbi:MAG TPA: hypothetical protein VND20_01025 [Candidatus Binataceae bacterium]|nr:hypothetical protein [Candidatus Binataceae bacterium]
MPISVDLAKFNSDAALPHGCKVSHIQSAMVEWIDFLGFINRQLNSRKLDRLEAFMMTANFSSLVGEFVASRIPKYCTSLVRNRYHNGHPDLVPKGHYDGDSVLHGVSGIEIKASRYDRGWQGHNAEECWLLVFVFKANSASDAFKDKPPKPFGFKAVFGAQLTKADWQFSGRSKTSRRTITASVTKAGFEKLTANWIYRV